MPDDDCVTDNKQTARRKEPWQRVEGSGDRAMRRGEFTICMYGEKPNEDYALFGSGLRMLAHGKTYQGMMDEADKLEKAKK